VSRFWRSSLLLLALVGFAAPARAQTPEEAAKRSAEPSDSEESRRRRTRSVAFDLKEHPTLTLGRALTLNFQGKFDVDSGVAREELGDSQLDLGRRRVGLSGSLFEIVEFQLEREIGDGDPWRDAFIAARVTRSFAVQAGKFKAPYSRAQLTSSRKLDFVNRPLAATSLSPGRQIGVMAEGTGLKKTVGYQVGLFREERRGEDARGTSSQPAEDSMVAARVTAKMFRKRVRAIETLEVGVAATRGRRAEGLASVAGRTVVDRSWFFPEVYVKGQRLRTGYEVFWTGGPVTLAGEFMQIRDERREQGLRGEDLPDLVARGWYLSAAWLVFGERRTASLPLGLAPFTRKKGGLEIGARLEALQFASAANGEPAFRNPRAAHVLGNADRALTLGINWYLSRFARLQCNVIGERVADPERSPIGSTDRFWSVVTRLQLHL